MKIRILSFAICSLVLIGCPTDESETSLPVPADACKANPTSCGVFTDPRDNQSYYTTQIGSQVWFAQNLNYKTQSSFCYDNKEMNCQAYGQLYSFDEALTACPTGWHLPSKDEWYMLFAAVGGSSKSDVLVSKQNISTSSDQYKFSALYGGRYNADLNKFQSIGTSLFFWTPDMGTFPKVPIHIMKDTEGFANIALDGPKSGGSVRCLKD